MNLPALIAFIAALQRVFVTSTRGPSPSKLHEFLIQTKKVGFLIFLTWHSHVANENESPLEFVNGITVHFVTKAKASSSLDTGKRRENEANSFQEILASR